MMKRLIVTMDEAGQLVANSIQTIENIRPGCKVVVLLVIDGDRSRFEVTIGTAEEIDADTAQRKAEALARGDSWR